MRAVESFVLDEWIAQNRPQCSTFLHDSCIAPYTLKELQDLCPSGTSLFDSDTALAYGDRRGSPLLRDRILGLYHRPPSSRSLSVDDIVITAGAISANFLLLDTLIGPEDHIIVQYPTYGQLFQVPRRNGTQVSLWRQRQTGDASSDWQLDLDELAGLIRKDTRLIVLNNPSNPTGLVLRQAQLEKIVGLARAQGITILCDEVFRPLFHAHDTESTPSLLDLDYEKSIVTGSLSKAYALPGIRVGWIAMAPQLRDTLLQPVVEARDYTTITVSQLDQQIAALVLDNKVRVQVLARSKAICARNLRVLDQWRAKNKAHIRVRLPDGAGTCVVQICNTQGEPVDDPAFAEALAWEEGVLAPPASLCFGHEPETQESASDLRGCLRVGVVMREGVLEEGLAAIDRLLLRWK